MPTTQIFSSQLSGHYQLLRETGRGGMSIVYEAEDTRIGRRVALKVILAVHPISPRPASPRARS